jgi:hemerythrin-like metal-binding protein
MPFFTWDPATLSVSVDQMDQEHQKLIVLMNRLFDQNTEGEKKDVMSETILELAKFTAVHFQHEEAYFDALPGYSGADTHKVIHADLLKKLGAFKEQFDQGPGTVNKEFFDFLNLWLRAHIAGIDKKYGEIASKKK